MMTRHPERIYATINKNGDINSITFYGQDGKRTETINLLHSHKEIKGIHVHEGYFHDEKGTRKPTDEEIALIDKIRKKWYDHNGKR